MHPARLGLPSSLCRSWSASTLLLLCATHSLAQRTDVVILRNGNSITGQVQQLIRGRLEYATDDMGTLHIRWDTIVQLTSSDNFEVRTRGAQLFYGSLAPGGEQGQVAILGEEQTVMLEHDEVVQVTPIKATFWGRLDGNFDLGFSFAQANDAAQFFANIDATKQNPRSKLIFSMESSFSDQEGTDSIERHSVRFNRLRNWTGRRAVFVFGQLESNEEIGIELRSTGGGGVGWQLKSTNRASFDFLSGLGFNREDPSTADDPTGELQLEEAAPSSSYNLEAVLGLNASLFTYDYPETNIDLSLFLLPGLSDFGRVRGRFSLSVRREFLKDLSWKATLWNDHDSDPPVAGTEKNDYGLNTSFGWSF